MKRLDGYVRVSRVGGREGDSYISPAVQQEAIQRWADYKGYEIAEWHVDEDWSGGTHKRPGLEAAVGRAVAGQTNGIVAWKIDRFSRYTEGGLHDLHRLEEAGACLAFVTEDIDTSGPMGKVVYTIMLAMAEYYLESIKAGFKVSTTRAIARGAFIGPAPLGYRRREDGVLEFDERAEVVREAFHRAAQGLHLAVQYLQAEVPERRWSTDSVRRLLDKRAYLGEAYHGELVNSDAHPALLTRQEWEAAQPGKARSRRAPAAYPLSGLITCAGCGGPLVGATGGAEEYRVYRCNFRVSKRKCEAPPAIRADKLEDYCRRAIKAVYDLEGWVSSEEPPVDLTDAQEALEGAENELRAFASDLTMRKALGSEYHAQLQLRVEAKDEAQRAYREASKQQTKLEHIKPDELFDTEDPEKLRRLVDAAFESIIVSRGRVPVEKRTILFPYGSDKPLLLAEDGEGSGLEAVTG